MSPEEIWSKCIKVSLNCFVVDYWRKFLQFEYLSNGFQGYVIKYLHRKRSCPYKSFEQVQVLVAPLLLQKWWWGSHVYWQLHSYCDSFLPTRLLGPTRLLRFYKCSLPKLWASPGFGGTTIAPKMVVRARSCEIMLIWSWACFFLLWSFS